MLTFRPICKVSSKLLTFPRVLFRNMSSCGKESSTRIEKFDESTMEISQEPEPQKGHSDSTIIHTNEGKVTLEHGSSPRIFYNPIQEVNRDISILGIETYIKQEKKENVSILEAMAASGIRSIRYAKEISDVKTVIANDYSEEALKSIKRNSKLNNVDNIIQPSFMDASALMHSQHAEHFIVDIDPYGTPIPFLDAAVQCVADGGLLLVTATDMAVLAGNTPETCYAKYGAMSLRSNACHDMALRILVHAVQNFANRYGRVAEPLLSMKIDFYARLFFRVTKSPKKCKDTVVNTSMVYQCTGCHNLNFQPLATKKQDSKSTKYGFAQGPTVPQKCEICDSAQHIGGPIWTGPIHDKTFVGAMMETLKTPYSYLNTTARIQGLLSVILEELDVPLLYSPSQMCSVIKSSSIPFLKLRSAFLNLGYQVSISHTGPDSLKTNAPNIVIWQILCAWHRLGNSGSALKEGTAGHTIMTRNDTTIPIDFTIHPDANPESRSQNVLRFQVNPTPNWGPGVRNSFDANNRPEQLKRTVNQDRKKRKMMNSLNSSKNE